jgi:hypothetical protein
MRRSQIILTQMLSSDKCPTITGIVVHILSVLKVKVQCSLKGRSAVTGHENVRIAWGNSTHQVSLFSCHGETIRSTWVHEELAQHKRHVFLAARGSNVFSLFSIRREGDNRFKTNFTLIGRVTCARNSTYWKKYNYNQLHAAVIIYYIGIRQCS